MVEIEAGGVATPRHAELWLRVRTAFRAVVDLVEAHLADGRYVPQQARPDVAEFDSGWPNLSAPSPFAPGPIRPSGIFDYESASGDILRRIAYRDVLEIAELIEYVRSNPALRDRICMLAGSAEMVERDEAAQLVLERVEEYEIARIPLAIMDRAYALGHLDDDTALKLYLKIERARFDPRLPYDLVVPVVLTSFDLAGRLNLGDDVDLVELAPDLQRARVTQVNSVRGVPEPLIGAATHAIVVHGRTIDNTSVYSHYWNPGLSSQVDLEVVDIAFQAISIAADCQTGYAQVLVRPLGWADGWNFDLPRVEEVLVLRRYPDNFDDYGWLSKKTSIGAEKIGMLPEIFSGLRKATQKVRIAARRLLLARSRPDDDDRLIDACIGLEALLGEGRDELAHRMALRAATILSDRGERSFRAEITYSLLKTVYDYRSSIVHGSADKKKASISLDGATLKSVDVAVLLLQELLKDYLTDPAGGWNPKALDARLLSALNPQDGS